MNPEYPLPNCRDLLWRRVLGPTPLPKPNSSMSIWISTVQNSSNQIQSNLILNVSTVPQVGSVIEVGEIRVFIRRRIGEGGFAFVYQAEDMTDRSKTYALKRLLVRKLLMTSLTRSQQNTRSNNEMPYSSGEFDFYGPNIKLRRWDVTSFAMQ